MRALLLGWSQAPRANHGWGAPGNDGYLSHGQLCLAESYKLDCEVPAGCSGSLERALHCGSASQCGARGLEGAWESRATCRDRPATTTSGRVDHKLE
jgi:hypothetical protein